MFLYLTPPTNWHELCAEGLLLPGHVASSFTCTAPPTTTFDPVANFVSAANLTGDCPCSLLTVLANNHPDQKVWLQSYYKEKCGIESLGTYDKISIAEYRAVQENALAEPYQQCVFIGSNRMRCSIHYAQSLG